MEQVYGSVIGSAIVQKIEKLDNALQSAATRRPKSIGIVALFLATMAVVWGILAPQCTRADLITSDWKGGAKDWIDNANWTPDVVGKPYPNNNATDTYEAHLSLGTATLTEPITIDSLTLGGSSIVGDFNLTINKSSLWTSGSMKGSGAGVAASTIGPLATMTVEGYGKNLDGRTLNNQGRIDWNGSVVYMNNGAVLNNGGTFDVKNDGAVLSRSANPAGMVNNSGAFRKSSGNGLSFVDYVAFNNSGTVQVDSGALNFRFGKLTAGDGSKFIGAGRTEVSSGATLALEGTTTMENLELSGKLTGSGTILGAGFKWLAGEMDNSGTTTIGPLATMTVEGYGKNLNGRTLNNQGRIDWNGSVVNMDNGAVLNNGGTFDVKNDGAVLSRSANPAGMVNNSGAFRKSSGNGFSFVDYVAFNNSGTVQVDSGTLNFRFGKLTAGDGSKFIGAGRTEVSSGATLALEGTTTMENLELSGKLTGSGTILGDGFKWLAGEMDNSGTTTIGPLATMTVEGYGKNLNGRTLNNQGRIDWNGSVVNMDNGAVLNNGGTFDVKNDGAVLSRSANPAGTVNNTGTFLKSAGSGFSFIDHVAFNNSGTVQIDSGTLNFRYGSYSQSAGTTRLAGGNIQSSSTMNIDGGSLTGSGIVDADVAMSGTLAPGNSPGTMTIDGQLTMHDTAQLDMEIGGLAQGVGYDYLKVTGAVQFDGDLVIRFYGGFQNTIRTTDSFTLVSASGISGLFNNAANGARLMTADGFGWFDVHYGSGAYARTLVIDGFEAIAVPEPGTWIVGVLMTLLLGGGECGRRFFCGKTLPDSIRNPEARI